MSSLFALTVETVHVYETKTCRHHNCRSFITRSEAHEFHEIAQFRMCLNDESPLDITIITQVLQYENVLFLRSKFVRSSLLVSNVCRPVT